MGVGEFLLDVVAQFPEGGVIVPAAGADEVLERATFLPGLEGDRLGGLAFEAGKFALQEGCGVATLLVAGEARQVAFQEGFQAGAAAGHGAGRYLRLFQKGLRGGVFQDAGHEGASFRASEGSLDDPPDAG